jgi:carotenoid cleavage dioxygenase-like enzyme
MDLKDAKRRIKISSIEGDYTSPEFSGINPEFNGYPARFGYCCDQDFNPQGTMRKVGGTGFNFTSIMKIDFKERKIAQRLHLPQGCVAGDPAFCPRPGATEEDDGWLCVVVKNVDKETTELHFYDGATLELAVALGFTVHIPLGFHSNYISEAQLQEHLQKHAVRSRL